MRARARQGRLRAWLGALLPIALLALSAAACVPPEPSSEAGGGFGTAAAVAESRGTEFILAFNPSLEATAATLSVQLHLASEVETDVTVEYPVRSPTFVETVTVFPGEIRIVDLPTDASFAWSPGSVSDNAVRATAADPFTLYMVNSQRQSSDAALGLPVSALNTRYVALDWSVFDGAQLSVTATYDDTLVTIVPSVDLPEHPAGVPFELSLDRGEGYFMRLAPRANADPEGLVGTLIEGSRPVQVTNGNGCAFVPIPFPACDHIFEVAQPVQTWGRTVPVTHPSTRPGAFYRIVAAEDGTQVDLDGVPLGTLDRGRFLQTPALYGGHVFEADGPIFVAQFVPGQAAPVSDGSGDPAMGNMVPAEQYLERYTFSTVGGGQFVQHLLTVIAHDQETDTLLLDGVPIGRDAFTSIPGTDLASATVALSEGTHTTFSRLGHGIGVFGFNVFDSYLYPGGARFESIAAVGDVDPPSCLASLDESGALVGTARDLGSGVFAVELEPGAANLSLAVDPFVPGDELVSYRASRVSTTLGARGLVTVSDGSGNSCQQQVELGPTSGDGCLEGLAVRSTIGAVQLSWPSEAGADGYGIERADALAGPFAAVGEVGGAAATWLDETAPVESLQYYRVQRLSADGGAPCRSAPLAAWVPARTTRMTAVPGLVGSAEATASSALAAAGLATGPVASAPSTWPAGVVAGQDPPRGSFVPIGLAVALDLSSGPADSTVPDVLGQTELGSELLLASAGLAVGAVVQQATDALPPGRVLQQTPLAGSVLPSGSAVDLVVSRELAPVTVPEVVGRGELEGTSIVEASGLVVGVSTTAPHHAAPVGEIIDQRPRAGSVLAPGESVDLVVSSGPAAENGRPLFSPMSFLVGVARLRPFQLRLRATDPDGDPLVFSLPNAPEGMTVDPVTGLIEWLPGPVLLGERQGVVARVADPDGAEDILVFDVLVQNYQPYFLSSPPDAAVRGETLAYPAVARDPDGDPIVFSFSGPAPEGMTLDPDQGLLRWTPAAHQVGSFSVGLVAADPFGLTSLQFFYVSVPNAPPEILSTPPVEAIRGQLFSYLPVASDPDGDPIEFSLLGTAIDGMSIDPATGLIEWLPEPHQVGDFFIFLQASDPFNAIAQQGISIHVPNAAPTVTSTPITVATRGVPYEYDVEAVDTDGDPITYELSFGPVGMTIDPLSGLLRWTPAPDQEGTSSISILVLDPSGATGFQNFGIEVPAVNDPPRITSLPPLTVDEDSLYTYPVTADDPEFDVLVFSLAVAPAGMTIDPASGVVSWTPGQADAGAHPVSVRVSDPSGLSDLQSYVLQVRDLDPDPDPPVVALLTPAPDAELRLPAEVTVSVEDDNLASWILELRPGDASSGTVLGEGFDPVIAAPVGRVDPTLLENGLYSLRLTAEDAAGNVSSADQTVVVAGSFKPGAFSLRFTDLSIALAGLPIRVEREYDSRRRAVDGQIGFGWRLGVTTDARYVNNRPPGEGWVVRSSGGFPDVPCAVVDETRSHFTEIRFSDREFFRFALRVEMFGLGSATLDGCLGTAGFDPVGGIPGATLDILGSNEVLYQLGEEVLDFDPLSPDFLDPYEPRDVRLTTADGRVFELKLGTGVTRIEDANGNSVFVLPDGVVHDNGVQLQFERDGEGRIARVVPPGGGSIDYGYDAAGDLVSVVGPAREQSRFAYDAGHLLTDYFDPLGNRPLRNEYDGDGRLVAQIDAEGGRHEIATDLATGTASVRDPLGATSTIVSDAEGNLGEVRLADGGVATFSYDARGNVLSETDPLGRTRRFSWDDADRLLSETNDLGDTAAYSWTPEGRLASMTGFAGDRVEFVYDASGNPLEARDADGTTVLALSYGTGGLLDSAETLGGVTGYVFDLLGRVQEQQLPGGGVRAFSHDSYGRVTSERLQRTLANGLLTNDERRFVYDPAGRLVSVTDPLGNVDTYTYDDAGLLRARTDPRGYRTSFDYDRRGKPIRVDYPDGSVEHFVYDGAGRRTGVTDRAGRTTLYTYDELGRLVETQYADGARERLDYDAAGQLVSRTDALGNATHFEYDAAGRLVRRVAADGAVTQVEYAGDDVPVAMTDPLGRRTSFVYDQAAFRAPRLLETVHPDGSRVAVERADSGNLATRTDETGLATRFTYDAAGRLVSVVDASGATTLYGYDEVGNRITETDALGRVTRLEYDGNRQLVRRSLPSGEAESFQYDASGNRIVWTRFSGEILRYRYDSMNRLVEKALPDGRNVLYVYTPTGMLASVEDERGITRYVYDLRDRLVEIQEPDGERIQHAYDAEGRLLSIAAVSGTTRYAYDARGRLVEVVDPDGGVTGYVYDAAGNVVAVSHANGTRSEYGYDARDRIVSVRHLGPGGAPVLAAFDYTLDPAGRRVGVDESGGRSLAFLYDAVERLVEERETVGSDSFVTRYDYDAAGQRLRVDRDGVVSDYSYDLAGRLLSAGGAQLGWDADGRLISRGDAGSRTSYAWDVEDRLLSVTAPDGTITRFAYDAMGRRVEREVDGALTRFLVDPVMPVGPSQVIAELDRAGSLLASHTHGLERLGVHRGGSFRVVHADGLGSVRVLSDEAGAATDGYDYDGFGLVVGAAGSFENEALFRGELFEPALGWYDLRARWMSPELGRFVSRDPLAGDPFEPRSLERYAYAFSDPIDKLDPSGRFTLYEVGLNQSVRGLLGSSVTASFVNPGFIVDFGKIQRDLRELPTLWLNENAGRTSLGSFAPGAPESGLGGTHDAVGIKLGFGLGVELGGGAVDKAFKLSGALAGTTGIYDEGLTAGTTLSHSTASAFELINDLYSWHAAQWMLELPETTGVEWNEDDELEGYSIPAGYFACGFNEYVMRSYDLKLMQSLIGPGSKQMDLGARIVGAWLAYANLVALQSETAVHMALPDTSSLQTQGTCRAVGPGR